MALAGGHLDGGIDVRETRVHLVPAGVPVQPVRLHGRGQRLLGVQQPVEHLLRLTEDLARTPAADEAGVDGHVDGVVGAVAGCAPRVVLAAAVQQSVRHEPAYRVRRRRPVDGTRQPGQQRGVHLDVLLPQRPGVRCACRPTQIVHVSPALGHRPVIFGKSYPSWCPVMLDSPVTTVSCHA